MPNEKVKEHNIECALQNAYKLFLANGIERTTIEMLARTTGISRSSLDRYFNNKLDLVLQTAKWVGENVLTQSVHLSALLHQPYLTGLEMLRSYLQILLDMLQQNQQLFVLAAECRAFVFRSSGEYPSAPETIKDYLGYSHLLEQIFIRGMEDGSIRLNLNPKVEAVIMRESILGFFSSMALADEQTRLNDQVIADLFVARIVEYYQSK